MFRICKLKPNVFAPGALFPSLSFPPAARPFFSPISNCFIFFIYIWRPCTRTYVLARLCAPMYVPRRDGMGRRAPVGAIVAAQITMPDRRRGVKPSNRDVVTRGPLTAIAKGFRAYQFLPTVAVSFFVFLVFCLSPVHPADETLMAAVPLPPRRCENSEYAVENCDCNYSASERIFAGVLDCN